MNSARAIDQFSKIYHSKLILKGLGFLIYILVFIPDYFYLLYGLTKKTALSYGLAHMTHTFIAASLLYIYVTWNKRSIVLYFMKHGVFLCGLVIATICIHLPIRGNYIYAEDSAFVLSPLLQDKTMPPFVRGYPFLPLVATALLFDRNIAYYNMVTFGLFAFAGVCVYIFLYELIQSRFIAFLVALFILSYPSYLDLFSWHSVAQGSAYSLILSMGVFVLFLQYLKTKNTKYYFLSLIIFTVAVHSAFVRTAGIVFTLPLLVLHGWKFRSLFQYTRALVYLVYPYFLLFLSGFILNFYSTGTLHTSTHRAFNLVYLQNYAASLSYFLAHTFFPAPYFNVLKKNFFGQLDPTVSIVVIIAIVFVITLLGWLLYLIYRRDRGIVLFLLGIVIILSNIFYLPIFQKTPSDISQLDTAFMRLSPPYGPGSRYILFPTLGLGILLALLLLKMRRSRRLFLIGTACFLAVIALNSNTTYTFHAKLANSEFKITRNLTENIFAMVPEDGERKLVYSGNPKNNAIDTNHGGSRWLHGFYPRDEFTYTRHIEELIEYIDSGKFDRENFYAFYYNPETESFTDISDEARNYFFSEEDMSFTNQTVELTLQNSDFSFLKILTPHPINTPVVYEFINLHMRPFHPLVLTFSQKSESTEGDPIVAYACAEDEEWSMQNQNTEKSVSGIWRFELLSANVEGAQRAMIDCSGGAIRYIGLYNTVFSSDSISAQLSKQSVDVETQ